MTLSPQDQMAGEYEQWAIDWKRDSLQPEYVVKKMAKADGEIKELLSSIDAMIEDRDHFKDQRDCLQEKSDVLVGEVDRLRDRIGDLESTLLYARNSLSDKGSVAQVATIDQALTPQPADYFEQPTRGTEPAITPRKSTKRIIGKVTHQPADTPNEETE